MNSNSDDDNKNEEIGRLPFLPSTRWWGTYVAVFSVIMVAYCIILLANSPEDHVNQRGAGGIRNMVNDLGAAMPIVAFLSYWGTEAIRAMVYFSEKVRESRDKQRARLKAEGIAAGIAAGKAEGIAVGKAARDAEWREWFNELQESQREGRPFNKPAPDDEDED